MPLVSDPHTRDYAPATMRFRSPMESAAELRES